MRDFDRIRDQKLLRLPSQVAYRVVLLTVSKNFSGHRQRCYSKPGISPTERLSTQFRSPSLAAWTCYRPSQLGNGRIRLSVRPV